MSDFTKTVIVDPTDLNYPNTIQAGIEALANLNQNGGTIIVEAGTYEMSSAALIPSNVTLIGRGNVVLKYNKASAPFTPVFQNASTGTGNTRIVISGFKIVIASNGYDSHPVWLENTHDCIVEKVYVTAKDVDGTSYRIDNNSNAILIRATAENLCYNNTVRQCAVVDYGKMEGGSYYYGNGIGLFSVYDLYGTPAQYCMQNSVINNFTRFTLNGCNVIGAPETLVLGNVFSEPQYQSVLDSTGNELARAVGILADYCDGSRFIGNQVIHATSHGIYITNSSRCMVSGNVSFKNRRAGIKLNAGPETGAAEASEFFSIQGNVCAENSGGTTDRYGIYITAQENGHSWYNAVSGNICVHNYSPGIFEGFAQYVQSNTISGNLCTDNAATEDPLYKYDIYTSGAGTQKYNNLGSTN